jgi:hypothetical protein
MSLGFHAAFGDAFNGEVDDLRIYNTALTSIQVNDIYNQQGVPGRGALVSNSRQIYVAPTGTYPTYTPTSGAQFPVFNTSNVSFYSSGGTSGGTVGQYLNFGSQTFNMSMGFSAVCQFAWTNGIGVWERIFDFGNGAGNNNILLTRTSTSTNLLFSYRIDGTEYAVTAFGSIPAQNTLYTVVAIYDPYKPLLSLYVNGNLTTSVPAVVARDTRTLTPTYVGRSNWGGDAYSNVNISYLSIYNCVLTSDEINSPLPTPQIRLKGVPLFNQLSPAATSSAVGAFSLRAVNGVSTRAVQVRAQGQFPPAAMTSDGPQTLTGYSFGGSGSYVASASLDDVYIDYGFRAFDNNIGTWWHSNYPIYTSDTGIYNSGDARASITGGIYAGEWLQIKMTTPILLISYSLVGRPGFETNRSPRKFWILGSNNDGANWSLVDTQTNINTWASPQVFKTFTISNPGTTYFNTFRIVVNEVGNLTTGASGQDSVQIASWNLVGSPPSADFYADERGNLLTAPVVGTTLQNWLGGATGYVTTWYDQSGQGKDLVQPTAANQGIINTATSPCSLIFNGTSTNMYNSNFTFNFGPTFNYTIRAVVNNTVGGCLLYRGINGFGWSGGGMKKWWLGTQNGAEGTTGGYPNHVGYSEGYVYGQSAISSSKSSVTWSSSGFSSVALYENASAVTVSYSRGSPYTDQGTYLYVGTGGGSAYYNGNIYEIEIFSTPLSVSDVTIMG